MKKHLLDAEQSHGLCNKPIKTDHLNYSGLNMTGESCLQEETSPVHGAWHYTSLEIFHLIYPVTGRGPGDLRIIPSDGMRGNALKF